MITEDEDDQNCTTLSLSVKQGREEIIEILLKNPQALKTANFYALLKESIKGDNLKIFQSLTEHLLNDPKQVKQADFQDLSKALIEYEGKEKMLQIFLDQSDIIKKINPKDLLSSAVERGNGAAVAVLLSHPVVLPHIQAQAENDPGVKKILDQFKKDYAQKAKENFLVRETIGDYSTSLESNQKWKSMIDEKAQTQTVFIDSNVQAANDEPNKPEQDDHEARSNRRFLR